MKFRTPPWKIIVIVTLSGLNIALGAMAVPIFFAEDTSEPIRSNWTIPISQDKPVAEAKPITRYSTILTRPIFFKSREPFTPPPPPPPPAPKLVAQPLPAPVVVDPGIVLGGIMMKEDAQKAYLQKKTDPAGLWVGTGDEFAGWKIYSISAAGILLRNGSRDLELRLYKDDHP